MKVMVVGGGGREHALAWKISQSKKLSRLYATSPVNAGISELAEPVPYRPEQINELADYADDKGIDLTVVGPEAPLAAGIVDIFQERDLRIFGPNKAAAELEASKSYAKKLMSRNNIPTARYVVATHPVTAKSYVHQTWKDDAKLVVKASGLAAGKGVIVCDTKEQAINAVDRIMVKKEFGNAGEEVVIEERLYGPEASVIGITGNGKVFFFPESQDYKPLRDGDNGPNTGGMGAYSPVPVVRDEISEQIRQEAILPTMKAMDTDGRFFSGCVYAAVILTPEGPKILEYNVRFGDPETQPLLMRLNSDLLPYLEACADGRLKEMPNLDFSKKAAVCVVLASEGYPYSYEKGKKITGLPDVQADFGDDVMVFHAGTREHDGHIYTSGGRVLGVTALGDTVDKAADLAYEAAEMIKFNGKCNRSDIGRNVMERGRV